MITTMTEQAMFAISEPMLMSQPARNSSISDRSVKTMHTPRQYDVQFASEAAAIMLPPREVTKNSITHTTRATQYVAAREKNGFIFFGVDFPTTL